MSFWSGKYLVVRRDGTAPAWPYIVLGARDPSAPAALRAYVEHAIAEHDKKIEALPKRDRDLPEHALDKEYLQGFMDAAEAFELYALEHNHAPHGGQPWRREADDVMAALRHDNAAVIVVFPDKDNKDNPRE